MEKETNTRTAVNILNFEQDLRYETEEIRPHAGIDNFLWVSYCNICLNLLLLSLSCRF
jgi:hypothetical protein